MSTNATLAVASIFVLMYGDPNEGYQVEGIYLNPEAADKAAKEYTAAYDCLVREYAAVDGEFTEVGEIEVAA
jgi:hypothetical protein